METLGPVIAVLGLAIFVSAFCHSVFNRRDGSRRWTRLGPNTYEVLETTGFAVALVGLAMSGHDIWSK